MSNSRVKLNRPRCCISPRTIYFRVLKNVLYVLFRNTLLLCANRSMYPVLVTIVGYHPRFATGGLFVNTCPKVGVIDKTFRCVVAGLLSIFIIFLNRFIFSVNHFAPYRSSRSTGTFRDSLK